MSKKVKNCAKIIKIKKKGKKYDRDIFKVYHVTIIVCFYVKLVCNIYNFYDSLKQ